MKPWFKIENKADKSEIWIYEQIGEDFWSGGGVTSKSFQKELSEIKAKQIDLHINSPGGEVFDGITIYNLIKAHPANVTTYIDGLAASIASLIALSGNQITMADNALFMIHNPWGMTMGDADDMRRMADSLDKVGGSIAMAYQFKTGMDEDKIASLMSAETWMTAAEAKDYGFVDEITGEMNLANCARFVPVMAAAKFKNIPEDLQALKRQPTATDLERILRDAGCTHRQAKVILSKGIKEAFRDVEPPTPEITNQAEEPPRDVEAPAPVAEQKDEPKPQMCSRMAVLMARGEHLLKPTIKEGEQECRP
jgi:ATP-dependent Clp endopeptidase proteolytic subunit ClpP